MPPPVGRPTAVRSATTQAFRGEEVGVDPVVDRVLGSFWSLRSIVSFDGCCLLHDFFGCMAVMQGDADEARGKNNRPASLRASRCFRPTVHGGVAVYVDSTPTARSGRSGRRPLAEASRSCRCCGDRADVAEHLAMDELLALPGVSQLPDVYLIRRPISHAGERAGMIVERVDTSAGLRRTSRTINGA